MHLELQIQLTTRMLGGEYDSVRRFKRNTAGDIILDINVWHWALKNAAGSLGFSSIDVGQIQFPEALTCPHVALYRRNYTTPGKKQAFDLFECIDTRTVLTLEIFVPDLRAPGAKGDLLTLEQVRTLFSYVGEHIGVSPWGRSKGWGKFRVIYLDIADTEQLNYRLRQKSYKLNPEFIDQHRPQAHLHLFAGVKLTQFTRDELLAIVSYYIKCSNAAHPDGCSSENNAGESDIREGTAVHTEEIRAGSNAAQEGRI